MKVIIFGTGELYRKNKEKFSKMKIVAFVDNDPDKLNSYIQGVKVIQPSMICQYRYDYILLVSKHYKEMKQQLLDLGIKEELILDREHTKVAGVRTITKYENVKCDFNNKKILLVSHSLSLTGAPLVLYNMAQILYQNNYNITIYSLKEEELLYDFLKDGISVSIFKDFDFDEEEVTYYFGSFNLIIVNTVTLYQLISSIKNLKTKIIWWLHEEDNIYNSYNIIEKDLVCPSNILIYGVSERAIKSYYKYSNKQNIKKLTYGIKYRLEKKKNNRRSKIIFAVIGGVDKRKAQDIFIDAISENWKRWSLYAEFWLIGSITKELKDEYEKMGKVKIWGALDHEELMDLYSDIDVIVCPSRNDPLPVVLAEGMMNRKVCIASDMTGTAEYIEPYVNGLICKAGDVDSLAENIQWVLEHKSQLEEIGERAFTIYEKFFSMSQFEKNVLDIVTEALQ